MQYGEFRGGFDKDKEDTRLVFYGVRYLVENYVSRRWTMEDIEKAAVFHRCTSLKCMQGLPCLPADWPVPAALLVSYVMCPMRYMQDAPGADE